MTAHAQPARSSQRPSQIAKQKARRHAKQVRSRSRAGWWFAGAIVAVLAVALVIALTSGGDDVAEGVEQVRPVQITGSALPVYAGSGVDAAVGQVAPTVTGQSFDGTPVSIEPGKPTLVVLLAHWCSHCQAEVPALVDWNAAGEVPAGVQVVGVSTGTSSDRPNYPPSNWLENEKWPWPVLADSQTSEAAAAFGLPGFPYFVLLDADGKVLLRQSGEVGSAALTTMINSALAG